MAIEKALESPGYLRSLEIKGGPGSGNFGHTGRPGKIGGSGGSGGGSSSRAGNKKDSPNSVAGEYLSKLRKIDKSHPFTSEEVKKLSDAGFKKVDGHDAFIRSSKNTPFAESFSMIQVFKARIVDGDMYDPRRYIATHFNKDKGGWMGSSEHGYSKVGIDDIIKQVNAYQGKK